MGNSFSEKVEEVKVPEEAARLFKAEDYSYLLSKDIAALELQEELGGGSGHQPSVLRSKTMGTQEFFFPKEKSPKKAFPQFFKRQLQAEWAKPMGNHELPHFVKMLYAVPAYVMDILQIPLVDVPVVALQCYSLLSEDGQRAVRESPR